MSDEDRTSGKQQFKDTGKFNGRCSPADSESSSDKAAPSSHSRLFNLITSTDLLRLDQRLAHILSDTKYCPPSQSLLRGYLEEVLQHPDIRRPRSPYIMSSPAIRGLDREVMQRRYENSPYFTPVSLLPLPDETPCTRVDQTQSLSSASPSASQSSPPGRKIARSSDDALSDGDGRYVSANDDADVDTVRGGLRRNQILTENPGEKGQEDKVAD